MERSAERSTQEAAEKVAPTHGSSTADVQQSL